MQQQGDTVLDPWKSSDIDLPSAPKSPPNIIDASAAHIMMPSKKFQQQEYDELKEQLWAIAATSNTNELLELLETFRINFLPFMSSPVDGWKEFLDSKNPEGSSALHVAACFGQKEICWILLSHGASVNLQDKHGWTPLVWATNNAREDVVQLLIEQGASSTQSLSGAFSNMSVGAFIQRATNDVDPTSQFGAVLESSGLRFNKSNISIGDGFYNPSAFDFDGLEKELTQTIGSGMGSGTNAPVIEGDLDNDDAVDQLHYLLTSGTSLIRESSFFDWSQCLPHQMYVFDMRQVERLSNVLVSEMTTPHITQSSVGTKLASATTLFLAVRYAHYYGSKDLMNVLFEDSIDKLKLQLQGRRNDMCFLAYWLANTSQLVYFLKRDPGLMVSSVEWQGRWSEVVQDIFTMIVDDCKDRLETIWRASLMDYESIPGGNTIPWDNKRKTICASGIRRNFGSKEALEKRGGGGWLGLFRRKKSDPPPPTPVSQTYGSTEEDQKKEEEDVVQSPVKPSPQSNTSSFSFNQFLSTSLIRPKPPLTLSPRSICTLLSSILFVMQSYQTHPSFQLQLLKQIFYCVGASMVNCFMLHSNDLKLHYCSRWKAMQVRMNLSVIEDWVRFFCIPRASAKATVKARREAQAANADNHKPGLENLIYPVLAESSDDLTQYLRSPILICQLLQVATQSFGQVDSSVVENPLKAFSDVLSSITNSTSTKSLFNSPSTLQFSLMNVPHLNAKQMYRIFIDYSYEKDEPLIAQEVIGYLEAHCIENEDSVGDALKLKHKNTSTTSSKNTLDLMSEESTPNTTNMSNVSLPKRMSLTMDQDYLLPFRIHFILPSAVGDVSPKKQQDLDDEEWGDKNELMERRMRKLERAQLRNDEEIWWERRMKIEVPEWVLKRIG